MRRNRTNHAGAFVILMGWLLLVGSFAVALQGGASAALLIGVMGLASAVVTGVGLALHFALNWSR